MVAFSRGIAVGSCGSKINSLWNEDAFNTTAHFIKCYPEFQVYIQYTQGGSSRHGHQKKIKFIMYWQGLGIININFPQIPSFMSWKKHCRTGRKLLERWKGGNENIFITNYCLAEFLLIHVYQPSWITLK